MPALQRVTHWRPRRRGRSFELSATAAPATQLIAEGGGPGEGAREPLAPVEALAPPSCSGLCLVSTWLPKAGD